MNETRKGVIIQIFNSIKDLPQYVNYPPEFLFKSIEMNESEILKVSRSEFEYKQNMRRYYIDLQNSDLINKYTNLNGPNMGDTLNQRRRVEKIQFFGNRNNINDSNSIITPKHNPKMEVVFPKMFTPSSNNLIEVKIPNLKPKEKNDKEFKKFLNIKNAKELIAYVEQCAIKNKENNYNPFSKNPKSTETLKNFNSYLLKKSEEVFICGLMSKDKNIYNSFALLKNIISRQIAELSEKCFLDLTFVEKAKEHVQKILSFFNKNPKLNNKTERPSIYSFFLSLQKL